MPMCPNCSRTFEKEDSLESHMRSCCPNVSSFDLCEWASQTQIFPSMICGESHSPLFNAPACCDQVIRERDIKVLAERGAIGEDTSITCYLCGCQVTSLQSVSSIE